MIKVETCAALDSWSSCSFISRSLCNRLGCVGTLKSVKLSALAAPATSRIIELPQPITLVGDKGQSYELKDVIVIDRWSLSLSDLPKQKNIRKFKHLQWI